MANGTILDYIAWRGDVSFESSPFNMVDNLVFSLVSYAVFPKIDEEKNHQRMTLREYYDLLEEQGGYPKELDILCKIDELKTICYSKRFGSVKMIDYVDIVDDEKGIQFSAEVFQYLDNEAYIAFRGTDDTIAGWKEDMAFTYKKAPAQEMAVSYLEEHIQEGVSYSVGGHSKGANLALYGCSFLSEEKLEHVIHVFANDGPGFCKEVLDPNILKRIDKKVVKIIPEYSVIGMMFAYPFLHQIILKSRERGLMQHNIKSWVVSGTELVSVKALDPEAIRIDDAVNLFVEQTDLKTREKFFSDIFDSFTDNGKFKTVSSARQKDYKGLQKMFLQIANKDPETRQTLKRLPFTMVFSKTIIALRHTKPIDFIMHNQMPLGMALIALGIVFIFLPFEMFPVLIATLFVIMAAVEVFLLFYMLVLTKWNVKSQLMRIYICIIFLSLSIGFFLNTTALASFAAIIFGIVLLMLSFSILGRIIDTRKVKDVFEMVASIIEMVGLFASGLVFIIANFFSMQVISEIIGWFCIADGSIRAMVGIIEVLKSGYEKHKEKIANESENKEDSNL